MNPSTTDILLYATIAFITVAVFAALAGGVGGYHRRLMFALAVAGFVGSGTCFTIGLGMLQNDFESQVVAAVETKYDVEVTDYSRGGGPEDLRVWTIDGTDRECFLDGLTDPSDFEDYTDPVLRCAAPIDVTLPELGSDD